VAQLNDLDYLTITRRLDHPLATGFRLTDGFVRIQVPDVKPRDTYIVVRTCFPSPVF
jgi:hypothetical protein